MSVKITDHLCVHCGLCCDGSLFADVELASRREAFRVEAMGLEVEDPDDPSHRALLVQPCAALKNKRCSIYQFRPSCCRTFECRLLQEVARGDVTLGDARSRIDRIRREKIRSQGNRTESLNYLIQQTFLVSPPRPK